MKSFFSRIGQVFRVIKNILVTMVVLLIVTEIVALVVLSRPSIPERGVLLIAPQGDLVEQIREPGADALPFALPDSNQTRVRDLVRAIDAASRDPRVQAIELDLESMSHASLTHLQQVREALQAFRSSGKVVLATQYNYSQAQYYLAAAADQVWLHPMGGVELSGIAVYHNYFRDALDNLNIKIHLFRAGKYKSAGEPLIRNSMSVADRQATMVWMNELWRITVQDLEDMRGINPQHLQAMLDHPAETLAPYHGDMATLLKDEHIIDRIGEPRQAEEWLATSLGYDDRHDMDYIPLKNYLKVLPQAPQRAKNRVAIITASGEIVSGDQPAGTVGGDTLADLLDEAATDDTVKAVVLRINSPGGSALASEVIRTAVNRVQAQGKPVVVSMAALAASGGYWIAAGADEIWAQPSTLTGSIGVFGIVPNITGGLERLGIHSDGLGTSESAGGVRLDRPMSPAMQQVVQMGVDHIYKQFVHIVAQGRHMTEAQVDALAQGRVWSGSDALRVGLVDQLGDLELAVVSAANKAELGEDYLAFDLTPPKAWPAMLAASIFGEAKAMQSWTNLLPFPVPAGVVQQAAPMMMLLQEPTHIYAHSGLTAQ